MAPAGGSVVGFNEARSHEALCFIDTVIGDVVADDAVIGRAR
jgi:hypothetical protein